MGKMADGALHTDIPILAARLYTFFYITTRKLRPLIDFIMMSDVTSAGAI